jgi:hypothetical protein
MAPSQPIKLRIAFCTLFALATASLAICSAPVRPETSHLAFVAEYIRELAVIEHARATGELELKQAKDTDKMTFAIHGSTKMQLELGMQISILDAMHLDRPFDQLIPDLTGLYKQKIELHQKLIDICSAVVDASITGLKPDIDYGRLVADLPNIRGRLEFIDEGLTDVDVLVFATLIDQQADSKGHASHLIITRAERANLIENLDGYFGDKLDQKDQDYYVNAASVLKGFLLKDFKSSDEPWE